MLGSISSLSSCTAGSLPGKGLWSLGLPLWEAGHTEASAPADRLAPVGPNVPPPGVPHCISEESEILEPQPSFPEMESSPVPQAGQTVERFYLCLIKTTQVVTTMPILMGHCTGKIFFLELLTHT